MPTRSAAAQIPKALMKRGPKVAGCVVAMVLLLLSFQIITSGQVYSTDGTTATGIAPGSPSGSYALSGFESINLYNGNLNVALPLLGVNGRGHAAHTMMLGLNENHWRVRKTYDRMIDDYKYSPTQYWWKGGPGYGPGTLMGRQVAFESAPSSCVHDAFGNPKPWPQYTLTRLTFTTPDGTEYELRDQATNGQPLYRTGCFTGASRGTVFISADGTAMTFIADSPIVDYVGIAAQTIAPSGYLMLRDGTRYRIDNGAVTWIRDRNGNRITFAYPSTSNELVVTDSLNRQVTVTYADLVNVFYDQITYRGFGGAPRTILVNYAQLSSVLRAGYAVQTMAQLFPELNGSSSSLQNNPYVVSSVMLPNNMQYQFNYNSYGEVARVVLPTGGAVEYDMAVGSGAVYGFTDWEIYRRLAERREYADGSTGSTYSSRTVYTATSSGPQAPRPWSTTVTVDHYNAGSTQVIARDKHYFNGSGLSSLFSSTLHDSIADQYPAWTDGREYMTEAIDPSGSGTTVLRRVEETWRQRAPVSWWTASADTAPPNDPRMVETVTTLADTNQVSKLTSIDPRDPSGQTVGFDQFSNRTDVWEYDFGSGAAGALARRSHTDYLTSQNGTDYSCDPSSTCNASANIANVIHLRNLPTQVSTYDSNSFRRAYSAIEYDNYGAADNFHAGLKNWPAITGYPISGLDSTFTASYPYRGNATAVTRYLLDSNGNSTGSITAYSQYDLSGNLVKTIDPRSTSTNIIASTFDFSDRFGSPDGEARGNSGATELGGQYSYAFPTLVTNALGHTAYAQFDYYLGRLVDGEDANSVVASAYYNDALDRPTQVIRASNQVTGVKSQSTFSYDDQNHIITTTTDQSSFNDTNPLKSQVVYDDLGRTTEKRQYETANDYISVRQAYDSLGRSYQTSNPFRAGDTILWMTSGYDALSRVTSITTPDNAVITTSYNGNTVTVTDQTGKQRKSVSDGLGRLTQLYEDPSGLNYGTSYTHDVLDNLLTVTQGTQPPRSFIYDSLKRLTSATNPENGTVIYQYDENGNPKVKTDARGVSAHFSYDALNRITRRWYNGSTSLDQVTNNVPALPSGVAASDEVAYFYDSQSLPSGAPPGFSPGYSIGRLVATVYGTGSSAGDYHGYDAAGRPVLKIQQTGGLNYPVSAIYNLAGAITTETYPSGRTVTYGYDGAGRTNSIAGNLGDGNPRSYSTGIIYSPLGGLAKEQFGTATPVYNKLFYNSRGQLAEIRESTSYTGPTDTNWNRGAIINDYSNNCGGICSGQSMTDNNGNLKKQENYIPDNDQISTYSTFTAAFNYDSLNRLQAVSESKYLNGSPNGTPTYSQGYTIDRWGNRTISQATGGVNGLQFNVDPSTNRLTAPSGYTMSYDPAGNLTNDTYTGQGQRNYDAENRMTQTWASGQWQRYTYDGNGQRVRRNSYDNETWQVYGLGGELLAEYAPNTNRSNPQKEYGYRNGQLLITAEAVSTGGGGGQNVSWTNVVGVSASGNSLTKNSSEGWNAGAVSTQTIASGDGYMETTVTETNTHRRIGLSNGDTNQSYDDIDFCLYLNADGTVYINEGATGRGNFGAYATGDVFRVAVEGGVVKYRKNGTLLYTSTVAPTYPLLVDTSLYTNGSSLTNVTLVTAPQNVSWTNVVGVSASGNSLTKNSSEGWNAGAVSTQTITSGDGYMETTATETNTHRRIGLSNGDTNQSYDDIDFCLYLNADGTVYINENAIPRGNFGAYATGDVFRVAVEGGVVKYRKNGTLLYTSTVAPTYPLLVDTSLYTNGSTLTNVTINSGGSGGSSSAQIHWMVTDQLGTPRMIFDQTGSLTNVSRHDYLPFGEEVLAGRTSSMGYTGGDNARQHFTQYERDTESGLDYAHARYYANMQGRFTGVDPVGGNLGNPQSFNRYAYVQNNPENAVDPSGMIADNPFDASIGGASMRGRIGQTGAFTDEAEADSGLRLRADGDAVAANDALANEDMAAYQQILESNPYLEANPQDSQPGPKVIFDAVELLDDSGAGLPQGRLRIPKPINPIRSATRNELNPNSFTLDVDDPRVAVDGVIAIRVKFHVVDGDYESVNAITTDKESRRWNIYERRAIDHNSFIVAVNVYDKEAHINPIYVNVRVRWKAAFYEQNKLNDIRYKTVQASIRLIIGPKDR
jgi:RHS repeat-associated protein